MALDQTDHVAEGLALLIDQYKNKPRLAALLTSFLNRCNELEAVFIDILEKRDIDTATGAQLDVLGNLVGQKRIGPTDDAYRIFIKTRIRANRSMGQSADIIAVASLAMDGLTFLVQEYYPASIVVRALDPLPDYQSFIVGILRQTKAAGVGLTLHFSTQPRGTRFRFAPAAATVVDANQGFADAAQTTGGKMIQAF